MCQVSDLLILIYDIVTYKCITLATLGCVQPVGYNLDMPDLGLQPFLPPSLTTSDLPLNLV